MKIVLMSLLSLGLSFASFAGVTEQEVSDVFNRVHKANELHLKNLKYKFQIKHDVNSPTVNAYTHLIGDTINLVILGGLSKHELINFDSFHLLICHQIGHYIGGAPITSPRNVTSPSQADYFSTAKCLKRVFKDDDNLQKISSITNIDPFVRKSCQSVFSQTNDYALCVRSSYAGLSMAKFFASLQNIKDQLRFGLNIAPPASRTEPHHAAPQCRLETYFQGALCDADADLETSQSSEERGFCMAKDGYILGARPLCWYLEQ